MQVVYRMLVLIFPNDDIYKIVQFQILASILTAGVCNNLKIYLTSKKMYIQHGWIHINQTHKKFQNNTFIILIRIKIAKK